MRTPPIPPDTIKLGLRTVHDCMAADVSHHFHGFVADRWDGALIGPFPALLRFRQFGEPAGAYVKALIEHSTPPKPAHEVAILVAGAAFASRYELSAHEYMAAQAAFP